MSPREAARTKAGVSPPIYRTDSGVDSRNLGSAEEFDVLSRGRCTGTGGVASCLRRTRVDPPA